MYTCTVISVPSYGTNYNTVELLLMDTAWFSILDHTGVILIIFPLKLISKYKYRIAPNFRGIKLS